jgi:MFS family permease
MFETLPVSITIDFYFLAVINIAAIFFGFLKSKLRNDQAMGKDEKTFEKRVMLLYLIPWIIFSMINVTLAKNNSFCIIQQTSASFTVFLEALEVIGVSIGAITVGFLADFVGRRIAAAVALTLYGVCTALGGLFNKKWAFCLMFLIGGVSWGSFFVLFIFVVWSDLANKENWAKMYALGLITYFASAGISALVPQVFLSLETGSLLTCLVSFFAIVPIFAVPELSSNDFIENMRIKRHIDSVKKLKNQG